jgi:hypothetical protein
MDPAANRLVDTASNQLLPTVSSVLSQPEPAETSAMAAATPAGRPAQPQVHVRGPAPANQSGCSQSGQPDRAVTAVAADQPPECPRFIALPPGSLGSVFLDKFLEVANASKVLPPSSHGVEHFIATKGPPIASKFRRLDAEKLHAAEAEWIQGPPTLFSPSLQAVSGSCGKPPGRHRLHSATAYSIQRAQPARTSRNLGDGCCHTCRATRPATVAR